MSVTGTPAPPDGGGGLPPEPPAANQPESSGPTPSPAAAGPAGAGASRRAWHDARDSLDLGLATLIALSAFRPAFGGWEFLAVGALGVVIGTIGALVGARRRRPVWALAVGVAGSFLLLAPVVSGIGRGGGAMVPTPGAMASAVNAVSRGWHNLLTTVPPVGRTGGYLAIPLLLGLAGSCASVSIARRGGRHAVWAAAIPVAILGLGVLEGTDQPAWWGQGLALTLVLVLWGTFRQRSERLGDIGTQTGVRWSGVVGMLVAAALVGVIVSQFAPTRDRLVARDVVTPPREDLVTTSPLEEFRNFRPAAGGPERIVMTVTGMVPTERDPASRIRIATLDTFDGDAWRIDPASGFQRVGQEFAPSTGTDQTARITLGAYRSRLVPVPAGAVRSVRFTQPERDAGTLEDGIRLNPATDTIADVDQLGPGVSTEVRWIAPLAPPAADAAGTPAGDPSPTVRPPEVVGQFIAVATSALGISSAERSPLQQLRALQQLLVGDAPSGAGSTSTETISRLRGYFSDGATDQPKSLGGHNSARMASMLKVGDASPFIVGNEEQFASALALIAHELGFPARVAMGFTIPDGDPSAGIAIPGSNVTAWPEVNVDGVGWVPLYDARPDTSDLPQDSTKQQNPPEPLTSAPPPPSTSLPDARPGDSANGDEAPRICDGSKVLVVCVPSVVATVARFALPPVLLIGGFTALMAGFKRRRRTKRRTAAAMDQRVAGGWLEVCDLARDLGDVVPVRATRRETAVILGRPGVGDLARSTDAMVFGPGQVSEDQARQFWNGVEITRSAMLGGLSWWARWKATVNPTSLRHPSTFQRPDPRALAVSVRERVDTLTRRPVVQR